MNKRNLTRARYMVFSLIRGSRYNSMVSKIKHYLCMEEIHAHQLKPSHWR